MEYWIPASAGMTYNRIQFLFGTEKDALRNASFLYDYTVIGESNFTESSFDVPSSFMVTP